MSLPLRIKFSVLLSKMGSLGATVGLSLLNQENRIQWNRHFAELTAETIGQSEFDQNTLSAEENEIIDNSGLKPGRALVLGCGVGREAIALAKKGWEVTGVDHSTVVLNLARQNALKAGISFPTTMRDLSTGLPLLEGKFELITMLGQVYSYIPGKENRINLLQKINAHLKPNGLVLMTAPMIKSKGGLKKSGDVWDGRKEYHFVYDTFKQFKEEITLARLNALELGDFVLLRTASRNFSAPSHVKKPTRVPS